MRFQIDGSNLKAFSKSIQYLNRIADELYIEAAEYWLTLNAVNNRKTAFASVKFEIEFFRKLEVDTSPAPTTDDDDNDTQPVPHCKVAMRSIGPLFKGIKNVDLATITLDSSNDCLNIEFECRQQLTKIHSIAVLEFSRLREVKMPDRFRSKIIASHRTFSEVVTGFHSSTHELCLEVTRSSFNIRNHIDVDEDRQSIRASHRINTNEFETFSIEADTKLSYSYPDFKAIVSFAEMINSNIKLEFNTPGAPMLATIRSSAGDFSGMLYSATMVSDDTLHHTRLSGVSTQTSVDTEQSQRVPPPNMRVVNGRAQAAKRKSPEPDPEFPIRSKKTQRNDHSIDVHQNGAVNQVHSDVISPTAITPSLPNPPRDNPEPESENAMGQLIDELFQNMPQAAVFIAQSDAKTDTNAESEQPLRSDLSEQRKTLRPSVQPESVDIVFETESSEGRTENTEDLEEDSIPPSPRQQRLRRLFHRCYEDTFNPYNMPGADVIYAPDSDEENYHQ